MCVCKFEVGQMITRAGITLFHQSKQAIQQTLIFRSEATKPVAPTSTIKSLVSMPNMVRVAV